MAETRPKNLLGFLRTREGVGILAILVTAMLIAIKLIASFITGSISIRADAFHSIIDLTGAVIGLTGIKVAGRPPDDEHAFGHGKAENLAGSIIGLLILGAAVFITWEAIGRLVQGAPIQMVATGIYITLAAIALNLSVSVYGLKVARRSDSLALEATCRDLLADSMSSIAVLAGLVLVMVTGIHIFDAVVALIVAVVIARTAIITMVKSAAGLMDRRLPGHEEEAIKSEVENHRMVLSYHKLRTRKSGNERHIDLHVQVPPDLTVEDAHSICYELEKAIQSRLPRANVVIHIEPPEAQVPAPPGASMRKQ